MLSLLIVLTAFNLLCLILTALLGYAVGGSPVTQWHPLAGFAATMICLVVHCIVFTYFIATAKWIQHAIAVKKLDPNLATPTRSFKMQALPAALLAMFSVFIAAILGAARINYAAPAIWHEVIAWASILINALVAVAEYRAIHRNGQLIDRILDLINPPD